MYFRVLFAILLLATETAVKASWPPQYDYVIGYVNDSVTLSCLTKLTSAVDWWYQQSPTVSVEQVVMSGQVVYKFKSRFTANSSKTGISTYYNLTIGSLQLSDSGMYTCMEDAGLGGKFPKLLNVTNTTNPARVVTQPTVQNTADRTTDTESLLVSPLPHLTSSGSAIISETMTTDDGSPLTVIMIIVPIAVIFIIVIIVVVVVVIIILVCRRKRNRHAREPAVRCTMSDAPLMAEEGSEQPAGNKIVNGTKSDTPLMDKEADACEPPADNDKTHLVSPLPHVSSNRSAIADDATTTVIPTDKSSVNDSSTQMTTDEPTYKDAAVSSKQAAESSSTLAAADTSVTSETTGVPLQWRQIEVSGTVTGFDLMGNEIFITHKSSGVDRVSKFVPPYESLSEVCILGRADVTDMVYWKPTKTSLKAVYIADKNNRCIWQVQVENGRKSKWLAKNISPCSLSVSPRQGLVVSTFDHKVIIFTASGDQTIFTELMREFDPFCTIMSPDEIVFTCFRRGQKRGDLPDQSTKNIRVFENPFHATFDTNKRCIFYEYGTNVITLLTDNGSQELMRIDERQMGRGAKKLHCIEMDSKTYILISQDSRIVTYEINY